MRVFAFDHRDATGGPARCDAGKDRRLQGVVPGRHLAGRGQGRPGYGLLCDGRLGRQALYRAAGQGLWIGRPVEWPTSRPLTLEPEIGPDFGGLNEWPLDHVVKVLCFCHPDDDAAMWAAQEAVIVRLFHACRRNRLEMLLEVIPSKVGPVTDDTTPALIERFYQLGVFPDWWKLEPFTTDAAWAKACAAIKRHDPYCRGIVVLGLGSGEDALAESFALAARHDLVRGFAVGRTIHAAPGRAWLAEEISADEAVGRMAATFDRLCRVWDAARAKGGKT